MIWLLIEEVCRNLNFLIGLIDPMFKYYRLNQSDMQILLADIAEFFFNSLIY